MYLPVFRNRSCTRQRLISAEHQASLILCNALARQASPGDELCHTSMLHHSYLHAMSATSGQAASFAAQQPHPQSCLEHMLEAEVLICRMAA